MFMSRWPVSDRTCLDNPVMLTKKISKILALLLAGFALNSGVSAQTTWRIKGQVAGEEDKKLAAATVALVDTARKEILKTSPDSTGRFELAYGVEGMYMLVITHTGYEQYRSAAFPLSDKDFGIIRLSPAAKTLEGVTVQSSQNLIDVDAATITYNVSRSVDAQGLNALEVLRKAPGVFVTSDNSITLNGRAGVLVLIDGRQTYLSGREFTDLMKTIPASDIKSIEIINSPTAKYDATGTAGIINIKMSKSLILGLNATATAGFSYGISPKHNLDFSFNYRRKKYNLFGSYNHFFGYYNYVYGSDRLQNSRRYNSATDDVDKRQRAGGRAGLDYTINKENTLGILLTGNFVFGGGLTQTTTDIFKPNSSQIEQNLYSENDYYFQETKRYNLNLNYKFENAAGRIFNIDADYGYFIKGNDNLQSNLYTSANTILDQNLYRTRNGIDILLKGLKFDYTTPLWKGILEAGAKYSMISSDNAADFFHVLVSKDSLDERRSNTFKFDEQISAGYLNYKKTVGKWSLQAGLRMESSSSEGTLLFQVNHVDSATKNNRSQTKLFPSLSLSVKPWKDQSLSLSYSRRIDRPAYQDLNPFVYLLDELSFWQGNPFLQPQLSHRASLQYAYKSSTVIGINFSYTDQFSTRITDTIESSKIVFIPRNLGVQKNIALSVTQNFAPAKWWDATFNGVLYQNANDIFFDQYRNLELKQLAGRISLQQRFKLPYSLTGEISSYFNTKRLIGANELVRATSQVDIALQKVILKKKGILRLAVNDIYKGTKATSEQSFSGFYLRNYNYYETRMVRLNFTYKFAESAKGPRNRSSSLENENNRIK
jgi:outer membrane receptor protein involved in Fe transport